ncbi:MAG: hypothetical protein JEY97_06915 [Bacteroidales bacterium]|nr:hypothetical protein [Bacteroidales bacterium]
MSSKEIEVLNNQIEKLSAKDFDLEAWKKYSIVILARIFGDKSPKIKQIESIEYDYSSWALRDTSGSSSYMETCKKLGEEILKASISEIETFGLPDKEISVETSEIYDSIISSLQDELKGSQFKEIIGIIKSDKKKEIKKKLVFEKLKNFSIDCSNEILSNILTNLKNI